MERIPLAKWDDIKKKAQELYGKYIKVFHFFSPNENIEGIFKNTIETIRKYIKDKIISNSLELKNTSLLNFYNEELQNYSNRLEKISDVYEKNLNKYMSLIDDFNNNIYLIKNRIANEQKRIFESITSPIGEK